MNKEEALSEPNMIPIKLEKRYPESKDEDITDAFMQGYLKGKADRPNGEWIGYNADKEDWLRTDGTPIFLVCDKCHGTVINNGSAHWNFCPNCGARMYKGGDEE